MAAVLLMIAPLLANDQKTPASASRQQNITTTLPTSDDTTSSSSSTTSSSSTSTSSTTTSTTVAAIPPAILGADIDSTSSGGNSWSEDQGYIAGKQYDHVLRMGWCRICLDSPTKSGYIDYLLEKQYSWFETKIGETDKSRDPTGKFRYEIILDGKTKYTKDVVYLQAFPIKLNVSGVTRIRLAVTLEGDYVDASTGFADPTVS
jgi:NPCBM/NEW2 domain